MTTKTNSKKFLSVEIPSEYFDTVKYYLNPDKKMRGKIRAILESHRDYDLCRIEDSPKCLNFKREVLAIVFKFYRNFVNSSRRWEYYPWEIDDSCLACACEVSKYIDYCYNDGSLYSLDNILYLL